MPQHDKRSTPRQEADRLLLAAPGDGWLLLDDIKRAMRDYVMPGPAHRAVAKTRKTENDPRHQDALTVGKNRVVHKVVDNAVRPGVWTISECKTKVRHRDWSPADAFVVPTIDALEGMARLLKATDWQKAAIVATFVEEAEKPGPQSSARTSRTPVEFAALGVAGLRSKDTVRRYLRAWMKEVGVRPEPGTPVILPAAPFPSWREADSPELTPATLPPKQQHPRARIDNPGSLAKGLRDHYGDDQAIAMLREALAEAERQRAQSRSSKRNRQRKRNGIAQVYQMPNVNHG